MHLADQGEAVAGHLLGEVKFPKRAGAVQRSAGDVADDLIEFPPTARGGHAHAAEVVVEIDRAILEPHRMVKPPGDVDEPVAQRVEQM